MNSALSRLNGLFAFTLTVLGCVTFLCFLSTAFKDRLSPSAQVQVSPTYKITVNQVSSERLDLANVHLDISANFSDLFDWNTKQLFVYILAEYESQWHPTNQLVLWDKILLRDGETSLKIRNARLKYHFVDDGQGLKGNKNVSLSMWWNVIPLAGQMPLLQSKASILKLPDHYGN